jgi:hypothetical protein
MTFVRVIVAAASIVGAALVTGAGRQAPGELPKIGGVVNASTRTVSYRNAQALELVPAPGTEDQDIGMFALLEGTDFKDGTIEIQVAGTPRPGASAGACRADDQLRRNHAVQYASDPEYPWHRLREETPGVYESYADVEAGAWTTMKIEVEGTRARLYVNGAPQPCLIVNDIKHGARAGKIALWAHVETQAYFGPITITGADRSPVATLQGLL